jgi:hypothetical protein
LSFDELNFQVTSYSLRTCIFVVSMQERWYAVGCIYCGDLELKVTTLMSIYLYIQLEKQGWGMYFELDI